MNSPSQDAPPAEAAAAEARRQLDRGEPLLAFNAAQEGLRGAPENARLRQLQALALARAGDVERAHAILQALRAEGHADAETLGLLARTHKDLALAAREGARRASHLAAGFALYEAAHERALREGADADAWYTGINAATMAALSGDLARARRLAAAVREVCSRHAGDGDDAASRYWREATLGEAALILGEGEAARAHYARAARLAGGRHADLSTTRRQARLLASHLPSAPGVDDLLAVAPVLVLTGHMVDAPGRAAARFPAGIEGAVRAALRERMAAIAPLAVYSSAACGADLLGLELARELGAETHVVLPFPAAEFRRASVDFAGGDWGGRFERALASATSLTVTSEHRASGSAATFEYANLVLTGLGLLRAQALDTALRALAVRDPGSAVVAGGAASVVAGWERRGLAVQTIDLSALRRASAAHAPAAGPSRPDALPEAPPDAPPVAGFRHELRAMLFADAVGYSQLAEDQVPRYIEGFLGAIAALDRRTTHRHEHVEVAGDGLYKVFGSVADAGLYALELARLARDFDRAAWGLPASFGLRIALHCGPVHCGRDPVTGGPIYTGPHTSRAARIEPITPPGQVYASSAFAAVAAAQGVEGFALGYVGRIPLAKSYGTLGLYSVRPA